MTRQYAPNPPRKKRTSRKLRFLAVIYVRGDMHVLRRLAKVITRRGALHMFKELAARKELHSGDMLVVYEPTARYPIREIIAHFGHPSHDAGDPLIMNDVAPDPNTDTSFEVNNRPKRNPTRESLFITKMVGTHGHFIVAKQGRHIIRIVGGPYASHDEAVTAITLVRARLRHEAKVLRKKPKRNPRMVRLGKAIEIRYKRDIGKHRGLYKHEFTSDLTVYGSDDKVVVR